jgi:hypothetical protein
MNKSNHQEPLHLDSFSLAFPPLPLAFQQDFPMVSNNDHLSLPTQTAGDPSPSQMDIQSPDPRQFNMWQNTAATYDTGIVGSQDDLSHLFNLAPSPGQRISRYGGT